MKNIKVLDLGCGVNLQSLWCESFSTHSDIGQKTTLLNITKEIFSKIEFDVVNVSGVDN